MHLSNLFAQLDVPISEVDEVLPTIVLVQREVNLHERSPLWPLGLADQTHASLLRRTVCLAGVALDARAHNVLPRRRTAPVARDDVVQVQVVAVAGLATVLAGVLVALENVMPREYDFLFRHMVIDDQ